MEQFRRSFTGVALLIEPTEALAPSETGQNSVWHYLKQLCGQRRLVMRTLVISIFLRLFALALPVLTALIVDRVVPHRDQHLLAVVSLGLGGVTTFQFISALVRSYLLLQLRTNLDTRMMLGFLDHLVSLPYSFFQRRSTGDLMMRVSSNATIREMLTSNTLSGLLDGVLVLLYLAVIFVFSPIMATIILALGGLHVLVFVLSKRQYRELMSQDLESQARSQGYLVQMLSGIETLKASGTEHVAVNHWSNLFVDELNVSLRRGRLSAVVDSLKQLLQAGSPLLVLSYGALLVMNGTMSLGAMLAVNALAAGFLMPLATLVDSALQLQLLTSYIERIDDVMRCDPEQDRSHVAIAPRLSGRIELHQVSFRHSPHSNMVIKEMSLTIEAGSSVAIVGKSGSGKSTLAGLLLGLYQPVEGTIRYDGHNLADLDLRTVRRQIGIVPQKPYIFSGSIRDNIALNDSETSYERIVAAAHTACIHDDITALPMGYENFLADGGSSLSGGQNQRLALARALLCQPSILLLDEATSALDSQTERAVMENLSELRCTRIIIAHRLSTIANADQIVVVDQGRIIAIGTHHELLKQNPTYRGLVTVQADLTREQVA
jgi:ABC-type bacteriocin/lantibiotic exporter with double-glycine peptidase domain